MTLCRKFEPSRGLNADETSNMLPGIKRDGLAGSAFYFDALTNDARLVLDTMRSAAAHRAVLLNYCKFINSHRDSGLWNCDVSDLESGQSFRIKSKTIVNASGPWANRLPHSKVQLRLSKGIHVVLRADQLPVKSAAVITQGKRILFVIPLGAIVLSLAQPILISMNQKMSAQMRQTSNMC
ncbi:MAG: FAD-dependent oxidoreductase [Pirellulales bacterium]